MARRKRLRLVGGDDLIAQMGQWLEKYKRPAWKPVVRKYDGPTTASKFSGLPWLGADESWPLCGSCKNPIHLFLQLSFGDLPREVRSRYGKGLFQFFFCTMEDCWVNAYGDSFSKTYLLRVVTPDKVERRSRRPRFNGPFPKAFPAKTITDWWRYDDSPCLTEFGATNAFGVRVIQGRSSTLDRVEHDELGIAADVTYDAYQHLDKCISGDKLAGWPNWVQIRTEYPSCPQCKKPMQNVVFSLTGENIPFKLADGGRGYIVQCSTHKHIFAFPWQSC